MTTTDQPRPEHRHDPIPPEAREHLRAAGEELYESFEALFPPGFIEHRRAARREMLLAARSLIDAALQRLDARDGGAAKKA